MDIRPRHAASGAILRAMSIFSGVKVVTILASLIRNKLIAVFVGPAGMGLVVLFNSIVDLVGTSTRLSIDQSAQRDIAGGSRRDLPVTVAVVRRWSLWLGLLGSAVMVALSPVLSIVSFGNAGRWPVFCLLAVVPACVTVANCSIAVNQGMRRFGRVASGTIVGSVAGLVAAVPLILLLRLQSIQWIIVAYGLSTLLGAWMFRPRVEHVDLPRSEVVARGRDFVRLGAFITLSTVITQAVSYVFVLYLNNAASTAVLGIYQGGYTLVNTYVGVVLAGIWMEYYPRLSAMAHSPRRTGIAVNHELAVVLKVLTPVLMLFIALAPFIVRLIYASSFEAMLPYITIAAVGVVLRAVSWCLGFVILAAGDGRMYIVTESVSALTGLICNVVGYRYGGFTGLGISYIVWYGIYTAVIAAVVSRRGVSLRRSTALAAAASLALTALTAALAFRFL